MITNTAILPTEEIEARYLLANTPSFIVRTFRDLDAVQEYAHQHSAEEIARDAMELARDQEIDSTVISRFYAMLVSLSFKSYADAAKHLELFRTIRYDFMPGLLDSIKAVMTPSTTVIVDHYPSSASPDISLSTSTGAPHVLTITPKGEGVSHD